MIKKLTILILILVAIMGCLIGLEKLGSNNNNSQDDKQEVIGNINPNAYSFYGYVENGEYVESLDEYLMNHNDIKIKFNDDNSGFITYIYGSEKLEYEFTYDSSNIYSTNLTNTQSADQTIINYYKDGEFLILDDGHEENETKEVYVLSDSQTYLDLIALKEEENGYEKVENYVFDNKYSESEKSIVVLKRAIDYLRNYSDYHDLDVDEFINNYLDGDISGMNLDESGLSYIFVSNNDQSFLKLEVDLLTNRISSYTYYLDEVQE